MSMVPRSTGSTNLSAVAGGSSGGSSAANKPLFGGLGGSKLFGSQAPPPRPVDPLLQRLYRIRDSYDQNSLSYRFQAVVYNTKGGSGGLGGGTFSLSGNKNPPSMTPEEWNQATADAPDPNTMVPHLLCGFKALEERMASQQAVVKLMQEKLSDMNSKIDQMKGRFTDLLSSNIQEITERNHQISRKLMEILQVEEVSALQSFQFSREEHDLLDRLEKLNDEVNQPNKYVAALNTLNLKAKLMRDSMSFSAPIHIDDKTAEIAEGVLKVNNDAIESLIDIMKKMEKTASTMETTLSDVRSGLSIEHVASDDASRKPL